MNKTIEQTDSENASESKELIPLPDFEVDIFGKKLSYLNNTKLKGANQPLAFSSDHISEMIKCSNDIQYFAENYYKIIGNDGKGLQLIKLRDYQRRTLEDFRRERFVILKWSRQASKCVYNQGELLIKHASNSVSRDSKDINNDIFNNNLTKKIKWQLKKLVRSVV